MDEETKKLYLCTVAPLPSLRFPPFPSKCTGYTLLRLWGGGGRARGLLNCVVAFRPYSAYSFKILTSHPPLHLANVSSVSFPPNQIYLYTGPDHDEDPDFDSAKICEFCFFLNFQIILDSGCWQRCG
jgi:hypothetical protein